MPPAERQHNRDSERVACAGEQFDQCTGCNSGGRIIEIAPPIVHLMGDAGGKPSMQRYNSSSMFEISVEETFSSGHALRGYRGKCENPHGHNYRVRVVLAGPQLNAIGLLYDFKDLKAAIRRETERLDHQYLNDLDPFRDQNPSAENLARHLFE